MEGRCYGALAVPAADAGVLRGATSHAGAAAEAALWDNGPTNADVAGTIYARCRAVGDSYQGDESCGRSTGIRHGWCSVTELMPASLGVLWEHCPGERDAEVVPVAI
jgi:hypothetical protein